MPHGMDAERGSERDEESGTAIARRVCETIECRLRPLIALSTTVSIAIIERSR